MIQAKVGSLYGVLQKVEDVTSGFKTSKNCLKFSVEGNAAGAMRLKYLLVHHSPNPKAVKGWDKLYLPVIWR